MISRLKKKAVILITASLLSLLILIVAGMNIISYISLVNEADETLAYISESGGRFPEADGELFEKRGEENRPKNLPDRFTPEMRFETRFFSVVLTADGDAVRTDTSKIEAVKGAQALKYAKEALASGKEKGFKDNYRYIVREEDSNRLIVFLDCTRKLESFKTFLLSSIIVSLAGFVAVTLIIIVVSGRIIRPIALSYEKQKHFITDASHELRTPLAIINANIDVIEDEVQDKESINDIRTQTERLKSLTEDLVTLSRMEEGVSAIVKEPFSASEAVEDTASGFKVLAESKNAGFTVSVKPDVTVNGDKKAFCRLVSILLDNAVKYTPAGGNIELCLTVRGKTAALSCKNTAENKMSKEDIARVFDRFYRTDGSRNSASGGHGIGLSIAKAITEAHSGKIFAAADEENTFVITALLPL